MYTPNQIADLRRLSDVTGSIMSKTVISLAVIPAKSIGMLLNILPKVSFAFQFRN